MSKLVASIACLLVAVSSFAAARASSDVQRRLAAVGARDLGRADPRARIELIVTFRRRHARELDQLVLLQSLPGSPLRGRYLTPAQFDAYFGPPPSAVAEITRAMAGAGFSLERVATPGSIRRYAGPIAGADRLFSADVHLVAQRGRTTYADVRPMTLPPLFARDTIAVSGLDALDAAAMGAAPASVPRPAVAPLAKIGPPHRGRQPIAPAEATCSPATAPNTVDVDQPQPATNGMNGYGPGTFESDFAYPIELGCGGSGIAIGVVSSNVPDASDLSAFYQYFGLSPAPAPYSVRSTSAVASTESTLEVTLDLDVVTALAPKANVVLYEIPDYSFSSVIAALNDAALDNSVDVLSLSLADCESSDPSAVSAEDAAAEQLVADGITVVAASGDTGYENCLGTAGTIGAPASSAYVVAVGGVGPAPGSQNGFATATGWSGSGGGASSVIARPSYQSGLRACSGSGRCIPDLALASGFGTYPDVDTAEDGLFAYLNGQSYVLVGTSLAAPLFAAMQAEADEFAGRREGFINPLLYADAYGPGSGARTAHAGGIVRDVTSDDDNNGLAGAGWDPVTGLGVPVGTALAEFERG